MQVRLWQRSHKESPPVSSATSLGHNLQVSEAVVYHRLTTTNSIFCFGISINETAAAAIHKSTFEHGSSRSLSPKIKEGTHNGSRSRIHVVGGGSRQ